jgi:hypothetical protein
MFAASHRLSATPGKKRMFYCFLRNGVRRRQKDSERVAVRKGTGLGGATFVCLVTVLRNFYVIACDMGLDEKDATLQVC